MSTIKNYSKLSNSLKEQLCTLEPHFINNKLVLKQYHKYLKKYSSPKTSSFVNISSKAMSSMSSSRRTESENFETIFFHWALLNKISPRVLFDPQWFNEVYCYHQSDDPNKRIYLKKVIKTGKHALVIEGVYQDRPIIVKWYKSEKRDTNYEIDIYRKLKKMGCDLPWFSNKFYFWGQRVLVLEKLESLSASDNAYQIGIDVISQLIFLHKIGIHCDIKPGNIMKKIVNGYPKYLLIDYGGVTQEPLKHGFRRWIWSPKWTSTAKGEPNQLVTGRIDFLELAYTMQAIINWYKIGHDGEYKKHYTGRLKDYCNYINHLDELLICKHDYKVLMKILDR